MPDRRAYYREWRAQNPDMVRAQGWKKKYGLTPKQVVALQEESDGLCASCYERVGTTVDHDHITGRVRGWLCHDCNSGIGFLRDDPETVRRAAEYLETA